MKSPGTIDCLKRRLFVLKQNLSAMRNEIGSSRRETLDNEYVKSYSLDQDIVVMHPQRVPSASCCLSAKNSSPPSSRQETIDSLKALDLSNPEVWNSIYRKLQQIKEGGGETAEKEFWQEARGEPTPKGIVSVDSSAVVYMSLGESNCSSRDAKTPIQTRLPSRDESSELASSHNMQKLVMKLLELKESEQGGDVAGTEEAHNNSNNGGV